MAPKPPQPIDRGLPGPGLLAQIIVDKYQDHLPLHRSEQRFERLGVDAAALDDVRLDGGLLPSC